MPDYRFGVPLFAEKVPDKVPNQAPDGTESGTAGTNSGTDSTRNSGDSAMLNLNNREALNAYIREHIREIVTLVRAKASEKDCPHELLMYVTDISKSTFYRIWKIGTPEEEIDPKTGRSYMPSPDSIARLCLVLGISITEHDTPPSPESTVNLPGLKETSHEKIMDNMWSEIDSLRNTIKQLEADRERLESENKRLTDIVFSREDDIRTNIARNNKLTDALLEAYERMHKMTQEHNDRLDKLLENILNGGK